MKKLMTILAIVLVLGVAVLGVTSQVFAKGGSPGNGSSNGTCTATGNLNSPILNQNAYQYSNQVGDCLSGDASCTRTMLQTMSQFATQQGGLGGFAYQYGDRNMFAADGTPLGDIENWVTVEATVQSADGVQVVLVLSDGVTLVILEGRQLDYLVEAGIVLAVGDALTLNGFYDAAGAFAVGELIITESGDIITLRNEDGMPLWAGGPVRKGGR